MAHRLIIIEVSALIDFEDLDAEDVDAEGNCTVDGSYAVKVHGSATKASAIKAALDQFHAKVPIASLDDFSIVAREATAHDTTFDIEGMRSVEDVTVTEPRDDTPAP